MDETPASHHSEISLRRGEEIELLVNSLSYGGRGVARFGKLVVFVARGLPGQRVRARITGRKGGFAEAVVTEVLTPSRWSVEAPCRHFPVCGGCVVQDLDYPKQVEEKRRQLEEIFRRIGGVEGMAIEPVIPAAEPFHYRNKMEFTVSNRRWILSDEPPHTDASFAVGLHVAGRFDKVLRIEQCEIQSPLGNAILAVTREAVERAGLAPYDFREHTGFLKAVAIRVSRGTGEAMVNFVTAVEAPARLVPIAEELFSQFPALVSVVNNIASRPSGSTLGEKELLLHGRPFIIEKLGGFSFRVSANAFFQTNPAQAERLFEIAADFAGLVGGEIVYDFFCGTGAIALFLAAHARRVFGFESQSAAVEDAAANALLNAVTNCEFLAADLERPVDEWLAPLGLDQPDVVILDPPRAGLHPRMIHALASLRPPRLVYVSCNPTTQARDIALLAPHGYRLSRVAMVDMFPHTPHIESVALLAA